MKQLLFISFLLISIQAYSQRQKDLLFEHEHVMIIEQVVANYSKGNLIYVNKDILKFSEKEPNLKEWCIMAEELTKQEAEEIFGDNENDFFNIKSQSLSTWGKKDFEGLNVELIDKSNSTRVLDELVKRKKAFNFTKPVVRKDRKYALIEISNMHYGGVLHIFKNVKGKWELYKQVQLYYI